MSDPRPESPRLRFREYTAADEPNVAALFADAAARVFYPQMADAAGVRRWIEWNLGHYRESGLGLWALELKASGAFVGDCGLTWQEVEGRKELEIGYHVVETLRRRGYALEAARACLDFALAHTDAGTICSIVHPANAASIGVARRLHQACRGIVWRGNPALLFYTLRAV